MGDNTSDITKGIALRKHLEELKHWTSTFHSFSNNIYARWNPPPRKFKFIKLNSEIIANLPLPPPLNANLIIPRTPTHSEKNSGAAHDIK